MAVLLLLLLNIFCYTTASLPFTVLSEIHESYPLPELIFAYDALEPFLDEEAMRVHHSGHHAAYTSKMNTALAGWKNSGEQSTLSSKSILEIIKSIEEVPEKWRTSLRNNGGGYVNHAIFFSLISPNANNLARVPQGKLSAQISLSFGNFSTFKEIFTNAALKLFGSGYVWLCRESSNDVLTVFPTDNQQSPLSYGLEPLLVIDVWEHAYYLKHKNKRPNYVKDWWNVVDWDAVLQLYRFWERQESHTEL